MVGDKAKPIDPTVRNEQGRPLITVRIEPEAHSVSFDRLRTVQALLHKLGLRPTQALVIRDNELLTQDRALAPGDRIIVRKVTSSG